MSTIDTLVSSDLATLGRETRSHVPALDAMVPDEQVRRDNTTLLELANTYANGAASAAWGAFSLAFITSILALTAVQDRLSFAGHECWDGSWFFGWLNSMDDTLRPFWVFTFGLFCSTVARRLAATRFAALIGASPTAELTARQLVARIAPWSIALRTAGITAFGVYFTIAVAFHTTLLTQAPPWDSLIKAHNDFVLRSQWHVHDAARFRDLCLAWAGIVASSVWVARRRPSMLRYRLVGWSALGVALLAVRAAVWLGAPSDHWLSGSVSPFHTVRTFVTAIGAVALFVAVASSSLRRSPTE
jgi:hypothetical protein